MPSPEQERLHVISSALAALVRQQETTEDRLSRIEAALHLGALPEGTVATPPPPPPAAPDSAAVPPVAEHGHSRALETRVGLTVVNRVGVVTLVLGIGFLFKLVADNQWIGPAGRVMLGVLAGFTALAIADVLWRRGQRVFAQGITATGVCVLYLSIYAAFGLYYLIPQTFAFVIMAVITAMAGVLAIRYGALAIASLGLLGGFLTPLVLSTAENRPWFLFGYVGLLDVGALTLARFQKWRPLEVLGFAGTVLLYAAWLADFKPEFQIVGTFYLLLFYALFAVSTAIQPVFLGLQFWASVSAAMVWRGHPAWYFSLTLIFIVAALAMADRKIWRFVPSGALASYALVYWIWAHEPSDRLPIGAISLGLTCVFLTFFAWLPWWTLLRRQPARAPDLIVVALNGAVYFGASYELLNPRFHAYMGLFAVLLAAAHLALGVQLWRTRTVQGESAIPVLFTLGVALTFLTLAAPIQFNGYRITMSWGLEAAALTWIGARLKQIYVQSAAVLIFVLVCARLCTMDAWIYPGAPGHTAVWNQRFLTFALAAACLWLAAYWLCPSPLALFYYFAGHLALLWTLTQEVLDWAERGTAGKDVLSIETVAISILYAVYAVVLIGIGVAARSALNRIAGLGLIGLVVVKLYLFDVWQLSRLHRTLAFVALGILLLSTSFLYSRFRGMVENWLRDDQPPS